MYQEVKPPFPILVNGGFGGCGSCADKSPLRVDEQLEAKLKEKEAELDRLRAELAKEAPKKNEVAKLKEVVEEQRLALDQPTVVSLRESGAVLEKTKRRAKRAGERIAREARERRRREVKAAVKAVSALYAKYETTCEQGGCAWCG